MSDKKYNGRRQEIYFPSIQDLQRWRSQAKKYHVPLSKWIYQFVESHLDLDQDPDKISAASEDILKLQTEVNRLRTELKDKSARLERAETDLFNLRYQPFMDPDPESAKFSRELIALLKAGGSWRGREILKQLYIDPGNAESIRIVSNQLGVLEKFGIIEENPKGWRWVADEH
jgi:hypothetical protein